jgi:hypothetical protein
VRFDDRWALDDGGPGLPMTNTVECFTFVPIKKITFSPFCPGICKQNGNEVYLYLHFGGWESIAVVASVPRSHLKCPLVQKEDEMI